MAHKLTFDGGLSADKKSTFGIVIYNDQEEIIFKKGGESKLRLSSNGAEYFALIMGLMYCRMLGIEELNVWGDSQLVIRQVTGVYGIKAQTLKPLYNLVQDLRKLFKEVNFNWMPREDNHLADRLGR